MLAFAVVCGMLLDLLFGEPRRAHPLVLFGRFADSLEARFNPGGRGWRSHGVMAWSLAVLPWVLLTALLCQIGWLAWIIQPLALYLAVGLRSLGEHAEPVAPGTRHAHPHVHEELTHTHDHYPDAHHRHTH